MGYKNRLLIIQNNPKLNFLILKSTINFQIFRHILLKTSGQEENAQKSELLACIIAKHYKLTVW